MIKLLKRYQDLIRRYEDLEAKGQVPSIGLVKTISWLEVQVNRHYL